MPRHAPLFDRLYRSVLPKNSEFRCLIIEQMQCELSAMLPLFVEQYCASHPTIKELAFGPVCTQLIRIVEAIHQSKHILLDVKPDNLMISRNFTPSIVAKSDASITVNDLAKAIRLVDLGLLKSIVGMTGSHTENVPASEVQGTPLYCSLHVHNLQTPSRRDDVYAMLYVIGEYILQVYSILRKASAPYGTGTKLASYFPWSQETSDAAIGKVKAEEMKSIKASYFLSMPNKKVAEILFSAHQKVHETNFAQKPNYDAICEALSNIKIPIPTLYSSATKTATSSVKRAGDYELTLPSAVGSPAQLRRSARCIAPHYVVDAETITRPSKKTKKTSPIESIASDLDDVTMYDARQGDEMDESDDEIMVLGNDQNEDHKPAAVSLTKELQSTIPSIKINIAINSNVRHGAKHDNQVAKAAPCQPTCQAPTNPYLVLKVTSPASIKGMAYILEQNVSDTLIIGSGEPSNKDKPGWIYFDRIDHQIEPKHASVSLVALKDGTLMVQVHDLKSSTGTYVSKKRIPTGKKEMAFCNHSICMGNVAFVVTKRV
jgi:serine/threonine protein kinase